jgi:hypothetical protein
MKVHPTGRTKKSKKLVRVEDSQYSLSIPGSDSHPLCENSRDVPCRTAGPGTGYGKMTGSLSWFMLQKENLKLTKEGSDFSNFSVKSTRSQRGSNAPTG